MSTSLVGYIKYDDDSDKDNEEEDNNYFLPLPYMKSDTGYKGDKIRDSYYEELVTDTQLGEEHNINVNIKYKFKKVSRWYIPLLI